MDVQWDDETTLHYMSRAQAHTVIVEYVLILAALQILLYLIPRLDFHV